MDRLSDQFEFLCKDMLQANGCQISYLVETDKHHGDLLAFKLLDGAMKRTVIETKFYRSNHVSSSLLNKAVAKLINGMHSTKSEGAILIVSNSLPTQTKYLLQKDYGVLVWDRNVVLHLCRHSIELVRRYRKMLNEGLTFSTENGWHDTKVLRDFDISSMFKPLKGKELIHGRPKEDLLLDLIGSLPGKEHWSNFEDKSITALERMFDEDLCGWVKAPFDHDGLNRNRLVCRVSSDHDLWKGMTDLFRSKYVVFEFLNSDEQVSADLIDPENMGLNGNTLRNVCFMISRKGFSDDAVKASYDILKEKGFLFIDLSLADLTSMLKEWELGDDPCNLIIEKLDRFMLKL